MESIMIALIRVTQVLAILIIAFFVALVLTLDLLALQQAELAAGAVVWLVIFGLLVKAEKQVTNRLVVRTMQKG